jgi:pyruvate,orthophosphate dikinase
MTNARWVYDFAQGSREMRELLGGKGANVTEMTRVLGAGRVPAGFTITTEACVAYLRCGAVRDGLAAEVDEALARLERQVGKTLGDPEDPLLVSVRSGARESRPGMLDTVLDLGLNDASGRGTGGKHVQRAVRVGLIPAVRADVRKRRARGAGRVFRARDRQPQT